MEINTGSPARPSRAGISWHGLPSPRGSRLLRYGQVIGFASRDIQPGDWVHSHNLEVGDMQREFEVQVVPPDGP